MKLSDISQRITFYSGQDTNNFPDADRLMAFNIAMDEIETLILRSQDDWEFDDFNQSGDPVFTFDTVANQQAYPIAIIDANIVQIKRVEITYDGNLWNKATEMGFEEYTNALDTTSVGNYFTQQEPKYALIGNNIWFFPIPTAAIVKGVRVIVGRLQVPITSVHWTTGSVVPGINRDFHDAIAKKVAYDFCFVKSLNNASTLKLEWEADKQKIADWYAHRAKDKKYQLRGRITNYR